MWPFVYERVEGLLESREGSYVQTLGCKCVSISGAPNLSKGEGTIPGGYLALPSPVPTRVFDATNWTLGTRYCGKMCKTSIAHLPTPPPG